MVGMDNSPCGAGPDEGSFAMNAQFRKSMRRSLVVALVIFAALVGYSANGGSSSAPPIPSASSNASKKLSLSDLMLIASTGSGIHMRYGTVTPGPLNATHSNDIALSSFQFGLSREVTFLSGTRATGKVATTEVTVTKSLDQFSPALLRQSLTAPTATATIYFTNLTGVGGAPLDYLQVVLSNTLITSFNMSSGGENPDESLSLNSTVMSFKYKLTPTSTLQTVTYNLTTGVVS